MLTTLVLILCAGATPQAQQTSVPSLRDSLTLHASFDTSFDADFAAGDPRAHSSLTGAPAEGKPGVHTPEIRLEKTGGRHGGALRFVKKVKTRFYYPGAKNIHYTKSHWSGTISFWLRLDPDKDLAPGYCDPIQITDKTWNKAALWVDFTKESPRGFRFGAYPDFKVWNPTGKKDSEILEADRPAVLVKKPPFRRAQWTQVVMTYSEFNNPGLDGIAKLYLDGKLQGSIQKRPQVFTWSPKQIAIMVGISYVGWFDDLALFNRALTGAEVRQLHALPGGVSDLRRLPQESTQKATAPKAKRKGAVKSPNKLRPVARRP